MEGCFSCRPRRCGSAGRPSLDGSPPAFVERFGISWARSSRGRRESAGSTGLWRSPGRSASRRTKAVTFGALLLPPACTTQPHPGASAASGPTEQTANVACIAPRDEWSTLRAARSRSWAGGMDDWAWEQLAPWLQARVELPVGPLFCVVSGPTRGRPWAAAAARSELRRVAREAGVRRRFAPHQLRHAHAVEMAREGVPLNVIQRPARPRRSWRHIGLPAGHRQHRDHRHGPLAPRADGPGRQLAPALTPRPAARSW